MTGDLWPGTFGCLVVFHFSKPGVVHLPGSRTAYYRLCPIANSIVPETTGVTVVLGDLGVFTSSVLKVKFSWHGSIVSGCRGQKRKFRNVSNVADRKNFAPVQFILNFRTQLSGNGLSGLFERGNIKRWISRAAVAAVFTDLIFNVLSWCSSCF